MTDGPRGRSGRSVGLGDDPTLPEIQRDPTAPVLIAEPFEAPEPYEPPDGLDEPTPFAVRMDAWRRHYLPLPDEVVHEYLGEDEYVVHTDHPSFRAFLIKNGFQVLGLGAVGLMFMVFARGGFDWWTILIFLLLQLILAFLALKRLSDRYTSYVITNLRLIRLSGIFGRKLASIPWTRMTGLGYRQKPLGRLLGYATIFIESANEESGLREFSDINDPAAFHQKILDMVSAKSGQSSKEPPPATRGERKSFLQRRRERRALSEERAKRAYQQVAPRQQTRSSPNESGVESIVDTGGAYEALSTSDMGSGPSARPASTPKPPSAPRPPFQTPPSSLSTPDSPEPEAFEESASPRRSWWPGGGTAESEQPAPTAEPARPERPPKPPKPGPSASRPARPKTVPPVPPTPPFVAADEFDDDEETEQPERRGPRLRPPWAGPRVEPPLAPPEPDGEPEPSPSAGPGAWWAPSRRRPGRQAKPDEGESARDALASLRRGHRPVQPVRRPRLPSFGRRPPRQSFPESRQLPASTEDTTDEITPDE